MSRICVKNLPKYVAEDHLREFFSQKGEVTDAKLMRTKDGKSRQFGFIGYRTEYEAEEALKYFNKSYLDTSRVICEIARKVGDPNIPRPWSRCSLQKQENLNEGYKVGAKKVGLTCSMVEKKASNKDMGNDDPQLQEFLQVMQTRLKSKLWANDDPMVETKSLEEESEDEFSEDVMFEIINAKKGVLDTGRLFVRNLPYTVTEDELEEHFRRFGNVSNIHLVTDKDTKRFKGIAFVVYTLTESATRALEELDKSIFQGRLLHILPAKQKQNSEKQESHTFANESSKTFKQKRQKERKALEAHGNTEAWNSLFMRPDTVVENIAREFGMSKSDVLDREADDLPVRIALGETKVIAETKKALVNAGVNITSLEEFAVGKSVGGKRSNHVILVKNLPYGSSEDELNEMFGKYGKLDKIILPPTKALALVVFLEPTEARAAFGKLGYKRYKDAPLYLEWAPGDILGQNSTIIDDANNLVIVDEHQDKRLLLEQHLEGIVDADVDPDRIESRSLYVKNLNFKTSDASLGKHFSALVKEGKVLSTRVKKHMKNGKNVSMGFGFIQFDSVQTAVNMCKDLQGTVLDGHALSLQLCRAKEGKVLKNADMDQSSTKLIVRNVAFEATTKDLRQLFSPFGQIKRIRLPRRIGHHSGFAFVEFGTKQEAHNALQALSSTHLYGRHLVLERAKERESLEELRAKTAAQFNGSQDGMNSTKLSKKRKHMSVFDDSSVKFGRISGTA